MNKVVLTGRITKDLELRKTQSNKSVLKFTIAVKKDRKNENGEYLADFINVICWEQKADYLSSYSGKGSLIGVVGRIENDSYTNRDGQKVYQTYIVAEQVEILESKKTEPKEDNSMFGGSRDNLGDNFFDDDELPFM